MATEEANVFAPTNFNADAIVNDLEGWRHEGNHPHVQTS